MFEHRSFAGVAFFSICRVVCVIALHSTADHGDRLPSSDRSFKSAVGKENFVGENHL